MHLTSAKDLKGDFQNIQSPLRDDYNDDAYHNRSGDTDDLESSVVENGAGQPLYNAEIYGSLRKGGAVNLFSKDCAGLVAATFSLTFAVECISGVIQPMLYDHFDLTPVEVAANLRISTLPESFCFFAGLVSDSYPIFGYRRKMYVIIGLALSALSLFALSGVDGYLGTLNKKSASNGLIATIIAFATLASAGNVIAFIGVQTRLLELTQREPLGMRGYITGTYLIFRCAIYMLTDVIIYVCSSATVHRSKSLLVFGIVVVISIPIVWKTWHEKYYSLSTPMSTRGQILWRIMQQKAVWNILIFLCIFTLFSGIVFTAPSAILSVWAGASGDKLIVIQVMYYGTMLVTMAVWRQYFMNRPWRLFYGMATVLLIVPQSVVAILVSQDILRDRYFFRLMTLFTSVSAAMGWLASMVPLTEILQEGSEGAMSGLMLSLYFSVKFFVNTNGQGPFSGSNFFEASEVALDLPAARTDVMYAMLVNYGINAFAFIGLYFLPRQKLDTQQLRAYGGYTKCASAVIATFPLVLFLYSVVVTILTLIPSTSCLSIAGGDGC
ncbi:putative MFS transporter superfamily, biopterin transporter family [Plasmopara halstedii]